MPSPGMEEFARLLVEHVRDVAIRGADMDLTGNGKSPVAKRWKKTAETEPGHVLGSMMIPDIVDETIFHLLHAIDEGFLTLTYKTEGGKLVHLSEECDGELGGWYVGTGGWCHQYTKERFIDDFADMNPDSSKPPENTAK